MASLQNNLDTLRTIVRGLALEFEDGTKTSNELRALYEAAGSVQLALLDSAFRRRADADRLSDDINTLTDSANWNLQELRFLITSRRERKAPGRSSTRPDAEDISRNLQKHTSLFLRVCDTIGGRENPSRLRPKTPRLPSVSPNSSARLQVIDSSDVTVSVPPSPYQPTVEDVEETDDEEEDDANHNVKTYTWRPKDDASTPTGPTPLTSKAASASVLPKLVVRQATDPAELGQISHKASEPVPSPLKEAATASSVVGDLASKDGQSSTTGRRRSSTSRKTVAKRDTSQRSIQELEAEIARLKVERSNYADLEDSQTTGASGRQRSKTRHSVDLSQKREPSNHDSHRLRASTTTGNERPKSFVEGSSGDPYRSEMPPPPRPDAMRRTLSARGPRPSSRGQPPLSYDPYAPYRDYDQAESAAEMYGIDPRTSLPTVLGKGRRGQRPGYRSKRSSGAFEDSHDTFSEFFRDEDGNAADAPLFESSTVHTGSSYQYRPRANSKNQAQAMFTDSRPYVSPRQLHEPIDLEPDVREIAISIEDFFNGVPKVCRIWRDRYEPQSGYLTEEEKMLNVPIPAGLKPGSKIKFRKDGHETPHGTRELHLVVVEKPHRNFRREGYDLHCEFELSLVESLCGWERSVTTICGKDVKFTHDGPTPARWSDALPGLGMCRYKAEHIRGDLIAHVSIRYPGPLSDSQKSMIYRALGRPGTTGPSPRSATQNFF